MSNANENSEFWVGVDLDGTLAKYHGYAGPTVIGEPIPRMVNLVKSLLADGVTVRILAARIASSSEALQAIEAWCEEHLGQKLEVTCVKDQKCVALLDDRALAVGENTGEIRGWPERFNGPIGEALRKAIRVT